jgi:protein-S-isoprenylcysteine O-methyltransferase Ste14
VSIKICLILVVEALLYGALLFGPAGTILWPAAWIYLVLFFGGVIWFTLLLARHDPALLAERTKPPFQKGQPLWDKIFLPVGFVAMCGWTALMPLDAVRFRWSRMPIWLAFAGAAAMLLSFWLIGRVSLENTFMTPSVKIQEERGHRVISTGPYAVVRHPLYGAMLIYLAATPLVLGSWYGLAGSVILGFGLAFRTAMEDLELHRGLEGYPEYAARVRYRLIPLVW